MPQAWAFSRPQRAGNGSLPCLSPQDGPLGAEPDDVLFYSREGALGISQAWWSVWSRWWLRSPQGFSRYSR